MCTTKGDNYRWHSQSHTSWKKRDHFYARWFVFFIDLLARVSRCTHASLQNCAGVNGFARIFSSSFSYTSCYRTREAIVYLTKRFEIAKNVGKKLRDVRSFREAFTPTFPDRNKFHPRSNLLAHSGRVSVVFYGFFFFKNPTSTMITEVTTAKL